jgi:hypothetical protein
MKKSSKMIDDAEFRFEKENSRIKPAVSPPKTKSKAVPLPDKLTGNGSGFPQVYHKGATISKVPGKTGADYRRRNVKDFAMKPHQPGEELSSAPTLAKGKAPTRAKKGAGKKAAIKPAVSEATHPIGWPLPLQTFPNLL